MKEASKSSAAHVAALASFAGDLQIMRRWVQTPNIQAQRPELVLDAAMRNMAKNMREEHGVEIETDVMRELLAMLLDWHSRADLA